MLQAQPKTILLSHQGSKFRIIIFVRMIIAELFQNQKKKI